MCIAQVSNTRSNEGVVLPGYCFLLRSLSYTNVEKKDWLHAKPHYIETRVFFGLETAENRAKEKLSTDKKSS